ncbi:alpha-L-rhamnosidase A precursor [Diaporthe sp. PMI_573]|nr:alpha-L-rhamnosidase A precursor [Diaporthaceae sp. PMI_573]
MSLSNLAYALLFGAAHAIPFSEYILAPSSRTVYPVAVYQVGGTVDNAEGLVGGADTTVTISGTSAGAQNSSVTLDFGRNIAGQVSLTSPGAGDPSSAIWLTFSESSMWVSSYGSDAISDDGLDAPIPLSVGGGPGTYAVERKYARGGFRYLTLVNNGTADIQLSGLSVFYTAAPTQDLQAYTGYFHSNDELLNRIWYAGAYTNQLCDIDPQYGNALVNVINYEPRPLQPWYYNYTITNGTSALVDGAKRDTLVWPGDLFISGPSVAYSTYALDAIKNSVESLFLLQTPEGILPYVGVPFRDIINQTSFTYHLHNLIGVYNYYWYTGDQAWLQTYWDQFKRGLAWSLSNVDSSGLMNVTASADWLRAGMAGHNIEANAILYYTLNLGVDLASVLGDDATVSQYQSAAAGIKEAANTLLWNEGLGFYTDNEDTTLTPQDGNSFAVLGNLTESDAQKASIISNLQGRWGTYGAPAPEVDSTPATISPFATGFELEAHLVGGNAAGALDLMRLQWGFMLDDPRMTNSTFIEGYAADGGLVYAPYRNDARVSHAHGWSSAPTSLLSRYVAGIHLTAALGQTWRIAPLTGGLSTVSAGMSTTLGSFAVDVAADTGSGAITSFSFEAPAGTTGDVVLPPGTEGSLTSDAGESVALSGGVASGVGGGRWTYSA